MVYSSLRYPRGKGKLDPFMEVLVEQTKYIDKMYIKLTAFYFAINKRIDP